MKYFRYLLIFEIKIEFKIKFHLIIELFVYWEPIVNPLCAQTLHRSIKRVDKRNEISYDVPREDLRRH